MDAALDLGVTFISNASPDEILTNDLRKIVQRDVMTMYGYNPGSTSKTSCSVPWDTEGNPSCGAGLWQWVVSTEDGETMFFTNHTVCRTGELYNEEPACPYFACANGDCSICKENW